MSDSTKSALFRKAERVIAEAGKQGYEFSDLDLGMFEALGRANWNDKDVNWLALRHFERLYKRFYPSKSKR